jgi:DNA polymerase I-like protein with 3'-5' exonuclease and polymerase domains
MTSLLNAATLLRRYLMLQKHSGMLANWLEHADKEGVVHGYVNSCGAVTGRCTHSSPNIAQVPSGKVQYGKEMRSCWIPRQGYVMVDIDLSGIELRCLAHYMQDEEWTKELLEGDVHTKNQMAAGLDTRDQAKTFIYALLYGAGAAKIGSITGHGAKIGQARIDKFKADTPRYSKLLDKVQSIVLKYGSLPGLDGRRLWVRSEHKALNTLLQNAGAVVAKQWMVDVNVAIKQQGIRAHQLGFIHDELVFECHSDDAEKLAELAKRLANEVRDVVGFRCRIDAEAKIGADWSEVH